MDRWKYYGVTHADHDIMNPLSEAALDLVLSAAAPRAPLRALDMGCGKGVALRRLARRPGLLEGVGVDLSPVSVREARKALRGSAGRRAITFVHLDGARYRPPRPHYFDVSICLGASWIFGGYRGTLRALQSMTARGGALVIGEPFWRKRPAAGYLRALGDEASTFSTFAGNLRIAAREGLELVFVAESSAREWDTYEGLQWSAALRWADANPDDPDREEVLERVRCSREAYVKWGRDCLGWAAYVFRAPETARARETRF